jgi:hypothetical protein
MKHVNTIFLECRHFKKWGGGIFIKQASHELRESRNVFIET